MNIINLCTGTLNVIWWIPLLLTIGVFFVFVKRKLVLDHFYNKSRWLDLISTKKFLDEKMTRAIETAIAADTPIELGKENEVFIELRNAFNRVFLSKDQIQLFDQRLSCHELNRITNTTPHPYGKSITDQFAYFGINVLCNPIILRSMDENNRGMVLYIFPETILSFVEGPERIVFIGAYKHEMLLITYTEQKVKKSVIINDKTQEVASYYLHFNPVNDSEIIENHWEVANLDGRRSFRGGLLPQHNPLHFTLKYGKLVIGFGFYSIGASFSNFSAVEYVTSLYNAFKTNTVHLPTVNNIKKNEATVKAPIITAEDKLLFSAVKQALAYNCVSTSFLQRKLEIGYAQAARIVDRMENLGIVEPYDGTFMRKVIMSKQEISELFEEPLD